MVINRFFKKAVSLFLTTAIISGVMIGSSAPTSAAPVQATPPIYLDTNYSFAERAADLVARMTLRQRTTMMMSTATAIAAGDDASGTIGTGVSNYNWWREALHGMNTSNATSFPMPLTMGQSWNVELMNEVASAIGDDIRDRAPGMDRSLNVFSPTVNLSRDPRWGRNSESYGEDPVHAAMMGAQFVNGVQGFTVDGKPIDPNGYYKAGTSLKHYFANNSEDDRLVGVANMTEQEAREYYSYVYRQVIRRSKPTAIMSSYNRIQIVNPTYSKFKEQPGGFNTYTLDTLLRQTFGHRGHVVSDCDSVKIGVITSGRFNVNTSGGVDQTGISVARGYDWGHGWRIPAYNWYGDTGTVAAGTGTIPFRTAVGWAVMSGAELECQGGTPSGWTASTLGDHGQAVGDQWYVSCPPNEDADASNAPITPLGRYTDSAVDIAVHKLMTDRVRFGEWDTKANYAGAPSATETSRVTWYDQSKARIMANGISLPTSATGSISVSNTANLTTDERVALVREMNAEAIVLLKNDAVAGVNNGDPLLPLTFPETGNFTVGVYGNMRTTSYLGLYSGAFSLTGKSQNPVNGIREALQAKYGTRITVTDAGATYTGGPTGAAANYDYIIAVVGDPSATCAEQNDRTDTALLAADITIIKNLYAANKKLIVVALMNLPFGEKVVGTTVDNVYDSIPALLWSSYLGIQPGTVGELIAGIKTPSARTNATWYPNSPAGDTANTWTHTETDSINPIRSYRLSPGIDGPWSSPFPEPGNPDATRPIAGPYTYTGGNRGRTYMYYNGTGNQAPRFPFGYGLSYTTFEYSAPQIRVNGVLQPAGAIRVNPNDKIDYTVTVTNTGKVAGKDVAQLYVKTPADLYATSDSGPQGQSYAIKRLKDFEKTGLLEPGKSETLTLSVEVPDIAFYSNANKKFELMQLNDPYVLQVSRSSADTGMYNGQDYGVQLSADLRINNASAWNPKVSVLSFKPNTPADAAADIPQRLLYSMGDVVLPNPTVCMANDVLYGYINRTFSSDTDQQYPIPSNITITYTSNRTNVVNVTGGKITAVGGGVATITGTATDSLTGSTATADFVVYVEGETLPYNVSLDSVTADGVAVGLAPDGNGYDVNIPVGSNVIPAIVATAAYPNDVDVVYTPPTAVPGVGKITVTSKTLSTYSSEYPVNFGHMEAKLGDIQGVYGNLNYMGMNTSFDVRFYDGTTTLRIVQAFYRDNTLVGIKVSEVKPDTGHLKNNAFAITGVTYGSEIGQGSSSNVNMTGLSVRTFLWDKDYKPLLPAVVGHTEFD